MYSSKIAKITNELLPSSCEGKVDENKVVETINYADGSTLSLTFEMEKSAAGEEQMHPFSLIHEVDVDDEYYDDEEEDDLYVMVGDEENGFLIHRDVVDVYIAMQEESE